MRVTKAPKNLVAWTIVGLLIVVILLNGDLHTDDVLGVFQGILIFGLLGIIIMLRWIITLRFWSALIAWVRRWF